MSISLTKWEAKNAELFNELSPMTANEVEQLMDVVPYAGYGYGALSRNELENLTVFCCLNGKHISVEQFGIVDNAGQRCVKGLSRPNDLSRVDLVGVSGAGRSLADRGIDLGKWTSSAIGYFNWDTVDDKEIGMLVAAYEAQRAVQAATEGSGKPYTWPAQVRRPFYMPGMYSPKLPSKSTVLVRVTS